SWVLAAVAALGATGSAAAQNAPLAPSGGPPSGSASVEKIPNVLGAALMGAPVRRAGPDPPHQTFSPSHRRFRPPGDSPPTLNNSNGPAFGGKRAALGAPESAGSPIAANAVENVARISYTPPPPTEDPVNDFLLKRSTRPDETRTTYEHNVPSVP